MSRNSDTRAGRHKKNILQGLMLHVLGHFGRLEALGRTSLEPQKTASYCTATQHITIGQNRAVSHLVLGDSLCKRSFSFILFVSNIQTNGSIEPSVSVGGAIQFLVKSCACHGYPILLAVAVLCHAGERQVGPKTVVRSLRRESALLRQLKSSRPFQLSASR